MNYLSEKHDSLWWVAAAPGIWGVHFILCYAIAAVWCAKHGMRAPLSSARVAIGVLSGAALLALGVVALRGYRNYRRVGAPPGSPGTRPRSDSDSSEARHQFVGFTLLSLAGLSAIAVVYEALAAVIIGSCH
jgi:hypothetical protein